MTEAPIDWLRIAHRGVTLLRALRGDQHVGADGDQEVTRAAKLLGTIDTMARVAVGCSRAADCQCPLCREARSSR